MAVYRGRQILSSVLYRNPFQGLAKMGSGKRTSGTSTSAVNFPYQVPSAVVNPKFPLRPALNIRIPPKFLTAEPEEEIDIQEYFVPVTRSGMVRFLLEEKNLINATEKDKFQDFATALDHCVGQRFVGVHEELKHLFTPLNPSAEVILHRKMSVRDRLDNEFWLLQKLSIILERANFFEVPSHVIDRITSPRVIDGVKVSINREKYGVCRVWAIGNELAHLPMPWYERVLRSLVSSYLPRLQVPDRRPQKYLKRVVVATRLKSDSRLQIKAFRDIPASRLHLVLPDGQLSMSVRDKIVTSAAAGVAGVGVFGQLIVKLAGFNFVSPLMTAFVSTLVLSRAWYGYKSKCTSQLAEINRTLFFKNVANGNSLLEALVFRARTETFKESLLVYAFLLSQKPPSSSAKRTHQQQPSELIGMTKPLLEKTIQSWARRVFAIDLKFDAHASLGFLESLGIVKREEELYKVQPLEIALRALPVNSRSLTSEEGDLLEGYDKDVVLDDILRQEQRLKRFGWG